MFFFFEKHLFISKVLVSLYCQLRKIHKNYLIVNAKHLKIGSLVRINSDPQNPYHLLYGQIEEVLPTKPGLNNNVGVMLDVTKNHECFTHLRWFNYQYLDLINP